MHQRSDRWRALGKTSTRLRTASGLLIDITTDPESPLVEEFYDHYDRAFVLPDEKEELAGFRECLALNAGRAAENLYMRYGEFSEPVLLVRDEETQGVLAGANFLSFPLWRPRPLLSINLNYVFVVSGQRRGGVFKRLVGDLGEIAASLFEGRIPDALPTLVFIEQNDPARMDPEAYALDTRHTGLDQVERLRIWARRGARLLDFPYVQPPLSVGQQADHNLLYAVLGETDELDPAILLQHLSRFFGISVLKGRELASSPVAQAQLDDLQLRCAEQRGIPLRIFDR